MKRIGFILYIQIFIHHNGSKRRQDRHNIVTEKSEKTHIAVHNLNTEGPLINYVSMTIIYV